MYIEFRLPTGAGGAAASHVNHLLNGELHAWSDRYNIPYTTKIYKYTKRVTFDDESLYAFFALTWDPRSDVSYVREFNLIEPMKVDKDL